MTLSVSRRKLIGLSAQTAATAMKAHFFVVDSRAQVEKNTQGIFSSWMLLRGTILIALEYRAQSIGRDESNRKPRST
jgi:hypothetical protein